MTSGQTGPLHGRRILVVGGATGIGRATVIEVAGQGATVAVADIADLEDVGLLHELGDAASACRGWRMDVRDPALVATVVDEAVEWLGGLDALVYVAGIQDGRRVAIEELAVDTWDNLLAVNLRGAFLAARQAVPHLRRSDGVLVLTSSGAGVFGPSGSVPYGASKGGMHGMALTLEEHLDIRVNEVAPGWIDTPLLRGQVGDEQADRAGDASGVARVMAFLCSPAAGYVRGVVRTR